jgi:Tfp pilus assembly protein PilO
MIKALALPLSIIVSAIVFFFFLSPTYKETKRIKEVEIPFLEEKIKKEQEITKNINSLGEDYALHKEELKRLKYILPENKDVKSLLVQIEALLLGNGMAYKKIGIEDVSKSASANQFVASGVVPLAGTFSAPSPEPISISLELKGTYLNFKNFIKELEVLDRICNVTLLTIGNIEVLGEVAEIKAPSEGVSIANNVVPDKELDIKVTLEFYSQKPIAKEEIEQAFRSAQGGASSPVTTGSDGSTLSPATPPPATP